jgi:hypothetical protein
MQFRASGIDRMCQLVDGRIDTPTQMFPAMLTSFLKLLHEAIDMLAFLLQLAEGLQMRIPRRRLCRLQVRFVMFLSFPSRFRFAYERTAQPGYPFDSDQVSSGEHRPGTTSAFLTPEGLCSSEPTDRLWQILLNNSIEKKSFSYRNVNAAVERGC